MKKILAVLTLSLLFLGTSACNRDSPAVAGPSKTYKLMGQEVSFVTPASPWVEKTQTIPEEDAELGMPADTIVAVTFRRPEKEGLIAVGALGQQKNEKGEYIELDQDKETLNQIANWVIKREGEITNQEYTKVLGVNAFHMTFEVGKDERKEKGEQVHFTKGGRHYSLSILVPSPDYAAEKQHFDHLLASFQTK